MITKYYITNDKNLKKKGRIVKELRIEKQYVKVRNESLDSAGI